MTTASRRCQSCPRSCSMRHRRFLQRPCRRIIRCMDADSENTPAAVATRWRHHRLRAARRLRDLRVAVELTQLELAARCGISNAQLSRYERAKEAPRPEAVG